MTRYRCYSVDDDALYQVALNIQSRHLFRELALLLLASDSSAGGDRGSPLDAVLTDSGRACFSSPQPTAGSDAKGTDPKSRPLPCRLTTAELVELLKMPTCRGGVRRVVLDHLGNIHGRRFANHWEFVRFAHEQRLAVDLTTPPRRPDPADSVRRMLAILDSDRLP
jgi:hypothetical protein